MIEINVIEVVAQYLAKQPDENGAYFCNWEHLGEETRVHFRREARHFIWGGETIPAPGMKFSIGELVHKIKGYKFPGVIIGTAIKLNGRALYLVECTAEGAEGVCHIFGENDIETRISNAQYE